MNEEIQKIRKTIECLEIEMIYIKRQQEKLLTNISDTLDEIWDQLNSIESEIQGGEANAQSKQT